MTSNPLSTICYQSLDYLTLKLNELIDSHIIQCYMFIWHKGEDGDRDHIHLRVEPNKRIDPMDLTDFLREYIPGEKPNNNRPWRQSKEEDWYLYVVHYKPYLDFKYNGGEKGEKLPYSWKNIVTSENYDCECAWIRALSYMEHSVVGAAKQLQDGENPLNLVLTGTNVFTVNALQKCLSKNDYDRLLREFLNLKNKHENLIDCILKEGYNISEQNNHYTLKKGD